MPILLPNTSLPKKKNKAKGTAGSTHPNEISYAYFTARLEYIRAAAPMKLEMLRDKMSYWKNMRAISENCLKDQVLMIILTLSLFIIYI